MQGDVCSPKVGIPSMLSGLFFSTAHVFSSTVAHALVYLNDTPCMGAWLSRPDSRPAPSAKTDGRLQHELNVLISQIMQENQSSRGRLTGHKSTSGSMCNPHESNANEVSFRRTHYPNQVCAPCVGLGACLMSCWYTAGTSRSLLAFCLGYGNLAAARVACHEREERGGWSRRRVPCTALLHIWIAHTHGVIYSI